MRLAIASFLAALLVSLGAAHAQRPAGPLVLAPGGQTVLPMAGVKAYNNTGKDGGIVTDTLTADKLGLILVGKQPGTATVLLFYGDGTMTKVNVTVTTIDAERVKAELRDLLERTPDVAVRALGPQVALVGTVRSQQDFEDLKTVLTVYGAKVTNAVRLDPWYQSKPDLVELELHFVEVTRQKNHRLGMDWGPGLTTQAGHQLSSTLVHDGNPGVSAGTFSQFSILSNLTLSLNWLVTRGKGRIIDTNRMVVQESTPAIYLAGGQLLIKVTGINAGALERIPYGTQLAVTPRRDASGLYSLKLIAEISSLDAANAVDGVPALTSRKIDTAVTLKEGQSVALFGLLTVRKSSVIRGLPWLGRIPILGIFFRSEDLRDEETEGIIFITPRQIKQLPNRQEDRKRLESDKHDVEEEH